MINEYGIKPGQEKLKAVSEFPAPNSVKKIREFVGLANYFRFLIPNFARFAKSVFHEPRERQHVLLFGTCRLASDSATKLQLSDSKESGRPRDQRLATTNLVAVLSGLLLRKY